MIHAYYNEIDTHAAQWLRNLISAGHIAPGDVDERDMRDVRPFELERYRQCHFFAGVGIWSYALRSAGWSDQKPVWTGSCPCQPFSAAGAGDGFEDERHLWPDWHWLIEQCRPQTVFGEQVASRDGLGWFDLVSADMEATDYAIGPVDTCAAGFGAPHIRQRLYFAAEDLRPAADWVADSTSPRSFPGTQPGVHRGQESSGARHGEPERRCDAQRLVNDIRTGLEGHAGHGDDRQRRPHAVGSTAPTGASVGVADANGIDRRLPDRCARRKVPQTVGGCEAVRPGPTNGRWADADWLFCRDGHWRPVRPGSFPLAHGAPARMGRLRAYGNGLCAAQAEEFVMAYMERATIDLSAVPAGDLFEWMGAAQ